MDGPSLDFLDEVLSKYKQTNTKTKTSTPKPELNVDILFEKKKDTSKYAKDSIFINKKILEALPDVEIKSTLIKVMSYDEMVKRADGVLIDNPNLSGIDEIGTPIDPRLGTIEHDRKCATCSQDYHNCPGHYGLIKFTIPRLNPIKEVIRLVIRVLNSVCGNCGGLKLSEDQIRERGLLEKRGESRLIAIENESKDVDNCSGRVEDGDDFKRKCIKNPIYLPKESAETNAIMYKISKLATEPNKMPPEEVFNILDAISDEDAKLLGFNHHHPRDLMLRGLQVIPLCSRPSNITDGRLSHHDLTKKYSDIIKQELAIRKAIQTGNELDIPTHLAMLDAEILNLHSVPKEDSSNSSMKKKTIKEIMKGKGGLIRKHIQKKRVDRSGRAVASINTSIRTNQVGVPRAMVKQLAIPETATAENVGRLNELLAAGEIIYIHKYYRGTETRYIKTVDAENKDKLVIEIGDLVDRSVQNGDFVMFGRNPTLSKYSLMGFQAVIEDDSFVISIPPSVTESFNADFDGDELNIFSMKTEKAQKELERVMNVRNHLISDETSLTNIGLKMDAILGSYFLSQPETFIHPDELLKYLELIIPPINLNDFLKRLKTYRVPIDSGRAILSATLPADFTFINNGLNIQNGILISGIIGKNSIASGSSRSLTQAILYDYDSTAAMDFLDSLTYVSHKYLTNRGHSLSVKDCMTEKSVSNNIYEDIELAKTWVGNMDEALDTVEASRKKDSLKIQLTDIVNKSLDYAKSMQTDKFNNLGAMVVSGSKGNPTNFLEITGVIGQQEQESGFPVNMDKSARCLPHFDENDTDILAHGFIPSNFFKGLNPYELYFNSLKTREDVISRAIGTARTGSFSRHIYKSMEDIRVWKNQSVQIPGNYVIQDIYGWDGLIPSETEQVFVDNRVIYIPLSVERAINQINTQLGFRFEKGKWV